jgi:hypothetical protein
MKRSQVIALFCSLSIFIFAVEGILFNLCPVTVCGCLLNTQFSGSNDYINKSWKEQTPTKKNTNSCRCSAKATTVPFDLSRQGLQGAPQRRQRRQGCLLLCRQKDVPLRDVRRGHQGCIRRSKYRLMIDQHS